MLETAENIRLETVMDWNDYVALRDHPFEAFQDWYECKDPLSAIEEYDFEFRYKVSPDKNLFMHLIRAARLHSDINKQDS